MTDCDCINCISIFMGQGPPPFLSRHGNVCVWAYVLERHNYALITGTIWCFRFRLECLCARLRLLRSCFCLYPMHIDSKLNRFIIKDTQTPALPVSTILPEILLLFSVAIFILGWHPIKANSFCRPSEIFQLSCCASCSSIAIDLCLFNAPPPMARCPLMHFSHFPNSHPDHHHHMQQEVRILLRAGCQDESSIEMLKRKGCHP